MRYNRRMQVRRFWAQTTHPLPRDAEGGAVFVRRPRLSERLAYGRGRRGCPPSSPRGRG